MVDDATEEVGREDDNRPRHIFHDEQHRKLYQDQPDDLPFESGIDAEQFLDLRVLLWKLKSNYLTGFPLLLPNMGHKHSFFTSSVNAFKRGDQTGEQINQKDKKNFSLFIRSATLQFSIIKATYFVFMS